MATGTITSLGIGSSLDLQGILDSLRQADEATITLKNQEKTDLEARKDEFNTINAKFLTMKTSALNLSLSSNYLARNISVSSTDVLSATVADGTDTGTYAITTSRIASQSTFLSAGKTLSTSTVYTPTIQKSANGFNDTDTEIVLEEDEDMTINYGYGDDRKTITITGTAGGMTLDDIVTAITNDTENDDGSGGTYVTASTYVGTDSDYYLQIAATSGGTGENNRVMVTEPPASTGFAADAKTFAYKVGDGSTISLSVTADTSLEDLATQINDDTNNPGVTATVIDTGTTQNPYKLLLKADSTGEDNRIDVLTQLDDLALSEEHGKDFTMVADSAITVSAGSPIVIRAVDGNNEIIFQEDTGSGYSYDLTATIADGVYQSSADLIDAVEDALEAASTANGNNIDYIVSYDSSSGKLNIEEAGTLTNLKIKWADAGSTAGTTLGFTTTQTLTPAASSLNALFTVDDIAFQRQSNTSLTDVVEGVTLTLKEAGSTNIDITSNTTDITSDIKNLVTTLNDLITEIDANDDYDEDTDTWGTLSKTPSIRSAKETLLALISNELDSDVSVTMMHDLGFETARDGSISIDEATLTSQISSNFDAVKTFFLGDSDFTGMADLLNDQLKEFTKTEGLIDSETDSVDARITVLENDIENETERLDKRYETMAQQFVELDSFMRQMESQQNYITQMFDANTSNNNS